MKSIKVKVPATTANLGPGFDCLGVALSIYNYIVIKEDESGGSGPNIDIKGEGAGSLEVDENNLVYRTMKKLYDDAGVQMPGFKIELINNIPLARGLGSSAACIAGALTAANHLLGNIFPTDVLLDYAVKIEGHPDNVVPAIIGGSVAACMEEGRVYHTRFTISKPVSFVAAVPDFYLSTQKARQVLPQKLDYSVAVFNVARTALLVSGLITGNFDILPVAARDRLHQPYRKTLIPGMEEVIHAAEKAGAYCGFLSGAGPTIISISHPDNTRVIGNAMRLAFRENNIDSRVIICRISEEGAKIINE